MLKFVSACLMIWPFNRCSKRRLVGVSARRALSCASLRQKWERGLQLDWRSGLRRRPSRKLEATMCHTVCHLLRRTIVGVDTIASSLGFGVRTL